MEVEVQEEEEEEEEGNAEGEVVEVFHHPHPSTSVPAPVIKEDSPAARDVTHAPVRALPSEPVVIPNTRENIWKSRR